MSERTKFYFSVSVLVSVMALVFMGWDRSGSAENIQEGAKYVGAAGCKCHQQERLGGQVQRWTGTSHARSYLALGTGCSEMIEAEAKGMVEVGHGRGISQEAMRLGEDTHCLKCHATATEVEPSFLEPTFHIEDGVQCEACHGPAGGHVAMMMGKKGTSPTEARLRRPTQEDCMACHHERPSHVGLKGKPFDFGKAWKKIAHPMPKKRGRK